MLTVLTLLACTDTKTTDTSASNELGSNGLIIATVAMDYSVGALATFDLDSQTLTENIASVSGDPVIIIDGGIGQLHAALEVFEGVDIKPPMVISLAKKEELIYTQFQNEPIKLGRENPGLKVCQAIRDEAHRFAQHYHHILRRKRVIGE